MLIDFKDEDFDNKIKNEDVSVIQFSAAWCGPCKALKKKFKDIPNVQYQPSIEKAIKSINLKEGDLLLITGSLYGAAEILNLN